MKMKVKKVNGKFKVFGKKKTMDNEHGSKEMAKMKDEHKEKMS